MESEKVATKSFNGQKPGTSGLRKNVKVFEETHYTENFVQAIIDAGVCDPLGKCLVVGGDGRYFSENAVQIIFKMAAANGIGKLVVAQNGIMSTPAVSCVIRKLQAAGGIILTASHNPGGKDTGDFGIKFNTANGGPAPDAVTEAIYVRTQNLTQYRTCSALPRLDLSALGSQHFRVDDRDYVVEVIDSVELYLELLRDIFDFTALRTLLQGSEQRPPLRLTANALSGVMGPYVHRILCDELGMPRTAAINCEPLPDFGGRHPDPNLTYAAELVTAMSSGDYDLGAAFDGDGDRNMILGHGAFFVSPCDSLAVLAAHLHVIPYFKQHGVHGYARSMPTSSALDRVAAATNKKCYETPTGWKYFGNLMDAGSISICGEESFGTGSDHIREKDGLWALLAWLSVISASGLGAQQLVERHWAQYGRNFFTRYDYEGVDSAAASQMITELEAKLCEENFVGTNLSHGNKTFKVAHADNFSYTDPIDKSFTAKQGLRVLFDDGSRLVFRLSGTGSSGATVRLYADSYECGPNVASKDAQGTLAPLVQVALSLSRLEEFTGRTKPTVIT